MSAYVCAIVRRIVPKAGESLSAAWERMLAAEPSDGTTLYLTGVLACPVDAIEDPDFDIDVWINEIGRRRTLEPFTDEEFIPSREANELVDQLGHLDIDLKICEPKGLRDDAARLARLADLIEGGMDMTTTENIAG